MPQLAGSSSVERASGIRRAKPFGVSRARKSSISLTVIRTHGLAWIGPSHVSKKRQRAVGLKAVAKKALYISPIFLASAANVS